MAPYLDIPAKLPGVELEDDIDDHQVVTDKLESNFAKLAAAALENVGINPQDRLCSVHEVTNAPDQGPAIIKANQDKIMYKITFDLPDAGLTGGNVVPPGQINPSTNNTNHNLANDMVDFLTGANTPNEQPAQQYLTQLSRSVIGNEL
jgi:hypothetical protein